MKTNIKKILALVLVLVSMVSMFTLSASAASTPSIYYKTHCQNIGWTGNSYNGTMSGTTGQSLRVEALQVRISGISGNVLYRSHCQNIGWTSWSKNGETSGTTGQSLRVEAVEIKLSGSIANYYDVVYRTHCQNIGWTSWSKNGATSGTTGQSLRVEAIEIKLVAKGSSNNTASAPSASSSGWQWPMNNYTVTQPFNRKTSSTTRPYHCGIDMVSSNTNICAAASGTVVYKGYSSGNGYHVVISHNLNGTTVKTLYAHLADYSSCPAKGQTVSKGAKIGVMGNTGNSTGAHLHFAVYTGSSNDPWGYAPSGGSNKISYNSCVFYNPSYIISNGRLP